jgi:uncharacterized membrane protein
LFAKTVSWGVVHVVITVLVVWALTGDAAAALAIGLVEPVVQTFAYAAHERFWQRGPATPPSSRQLVLKTFSYLVVHIGVASSLVWVMTGDLMAALTLGLIEPLVQTVAFNVHERAWASRARGARPEDDPAVI